MLLGGQFQAQLDGGQSLAVAGHIDLQVLVDRPVSVPFRLKGGALAKATFAPLGDQAATPQPALGDGAAGGPTPPGAPATDGEPLTVVLPGAGRWRLELVLRYRVQRQGGWQVVDGQIPAAVATALRLEVAQAHTEVVLRGGPDRGTVETQRDGQVIETALAADGALHVEWRRETGPGPGRSKPIRDE